jgi:hypothetical protein
MKHNYVSTRTDIATALYLIYQINLMYSETASVEIMHTDIAEFNNF